MEHENRRRPWRRWVVLVLMIVGFILGGIFVPVQPEIVVAPEKLIEEPIVENFLGFGPLYLVNTEARMMTSVRQPTCPIITISKVFRMVLPLCSDCAMLHDYN